MKVTLSTEDFDAVIFDLDGVLTKTATVHAHAWKQMFDKYLKTHSEKENIPFKPFDAEKDYLQYVDGKPRFEGIKSFLKSRNIELPLGDIKDDPKTLSVCGLGNKKNQMFQERLKTFGVDVYPTTVSLINTIKKVGIKTALISSSKNCQKILDVTKLNHLFDVKVDGKDAEKLGIKGKPNPDVFLEAAKLLNVSPDRAIVVEDAISGVQAASRGNFGLVIGVNRGNQEKELKKCGADIVVNDLGEILFTKLKLPNALVQFDKIKDEIHQKHLALFFDFDGTLSQIVERPELATLSKEIKQGLKKLSKTGTVAIISGRDLKDVMAKVGIENIYYAGSHGFEIEGPDNYKFENDQGKRFTKELDKTEDELKNLLKDIKGTIIERKKYAIAVHFRLAKENDIEKISQIVNQVHQNHQNLRKTQGKKNL